jgi:hypothetical protein
MGEVNVHEFITVVAVRFGGRIQFRRPDFLECELCVPELGLDLV